MANKKKPRPKPPVATETDEGVQIVYEGRVLPPPLAPLRRKRHCPKCGTGPVASTQRYGSTNSAYLYECPRCVDEDRCLPTRWQEPR